MIHSNPKRPKPFTLQKLTPIIETLSHRRAPNPEAIERANYLRILQSWSA